MLFGRSTPAMVTAEEALPGRAEPMPVAPAHHVNGHRLQEPFPDGLEVADFAMGCFWGAERIFWQIPGVYTTAVGYEGGFTPNPTYEETCTGRTGHTESVRVVFDPAEVSYEDLLAKFWEDHDPTQVDGQGNDIGTQYRSAVFTHSPGQQGAAEASRQRYQERLTERGFGPIATEIVPAGEFFYAEDHHQQYLAKNPGGYCNHGFCQVSFADA